MHAPRWSLPLACALALSCATPVAPESPPDTDADADTDTDTDADTDVDVDVDVDTTLPEEGSLLVLSGADALLGGTPIEVSGFGGVACGGWVSAGADGVIVHCQDPDASSTEGLLHLVDGAALLDGVADVRATVSGAWVSAGSAVAGLGDLDGDARGDLGLRSNAGSGTDLGRVLPGAAWAGETALGDVGWRLSGEDGYAGLAPQVVADTDGDGGADLVVVQETSGYVDDTSIGTRVYVVAGVGLEGAAAGTRVDIPSLAGRTLVGTRALGAPRAVGGIGDVDGDGLEDVGVAFGPWEELGPDQAGDLRLVLSSKQDDSLDACPAIRGVQVGRWLGVVFAPLGDLDGDTRDELVVGFIMEGPEGSSSRHLEIGVVRGGDLATEGDTELSPWDADLHGYHGVTCDLDGDGAREWVTSDGIWAGTTLLDPDPAPIAVGVDPLACLGDLDADGAEELGL